MKQPKPGPKARAEPDPKPTFRQILTDLREQVEPQTHASAVLAVVSIIDYDLERCIECKFRKLSSGQTNRLFRGYGPLSTFSA